MWRRGPCGLARAACQDPSRASSSRAVADESENPGRRPHGDHMAPTRPFNRGGGGAGDPCDAAGPHRDHTSTRSSGSNSRGNRWFMRNRLVCPGLSFPGRDAPSSGTRPALLAAQAGPARHVIVPIQSTGSVVGSGCRSNRGKGLSTSTWATASIQTASCASRRPSASLWSRSSLPQWSSEMHYPAGEVGEIACEGRRDEGLGETTRRMLLLFARRLSIRRRNFRFGSRLKTLAEVES